MAMSQRETTLIKITIATVIVVVVFTGGKALLTMGSDSGSASASNIQFQDLFDHIRNVEDQKAKNNQLRKRLGNLNGEFITQKETYRFLAELEKVAGKSGTQIKSYSYDINRRTRPLPRMDVKVTIQCQFPQIIQFADNLRTAEILCQLTDLKCSMKDPKKPDLEVQATISTFIIDGQRQRANPSANLVRG